MEQRPSTDAEIGLRPLWAEPEIAFALGFLTAILLVTILSSFGLWRFL